MGSTDPRNRGWNFRWALQSAWRLFFKPKPKPTREAKELARYLARVNAVASPVRR